MVRLKNLIKDMCQEINIFVIVIQKQKCLQAKKSLYNKITEKKL